MARRHTVAYWSGIAGILAILLIAFAVKVSIFKECRQAGFSVMYCMFK